MKTFWWESKTIGCSNFIEAETKGKAKYKLWLQGASDYFESFSDFLKDIRMLTVSKESK